MTVTTMRQIYLKTWNLKIPDVSPWRFPNPEIPNLGAFNTNAIVFDNTPWRPGREINLEHKLAEEDERKLKNLATRIMSNGVEVLVKDKEADMKPEQTKYMEVKTIQPSTPSHIFVSDLPKIDKRIDEDDLNNYDLIEPSELNHTPCTTTSCSCSHTKTEGLKTKYTNLQGSHSSVLAKYPLKTSKFGSTIMGHNPTHKDTVDRTQYPYEYENNLKVAPTDKIVEKYTEVINDYSEEKDPGSVEESELLTNEQAPRPPKPKQPEKNKPDKIVFKPNKNKFVGDLLKLGSLGIKGLSQLAPVFEKMTGGFIKRYDSINKTFVSTTTSTTVKPIEKLTSYHVDKRVDSDVDFKNGQNFPIYIPVDELETSESQNIFSNVTLQQNLAWAAEHNKHSKAHNILPPKIIHESPLVNGGIPISPGEIINANSDVIVGKPAVGGPLTLSASGIKLHNNVKSPALDSYQAGSEQYVVKEIPLMNEQSMMDAKIDDSFDLRPPNLPREKPIRNLPPPLANYEQYNKKPKVGHKFTPYPSINYKENMMKTEHIKSSSTSLGNHGRPAFLDYIPSLAKSTTKKPSTLGYDFEMLTDEEIPDNSPSSSEISSTRVRTEPEYPLNLPETINKPFLVDIQPSKVANVLIPHGSTTALVFAGSSEPHKTGDYVDDPLPYPEPGYFGSFSIDAPQMTNVHVAPNSKPYVSNNRAPNVEYYKPKDQSIRNDLKLKWKDYKRPVDYHNIPPPASNFETHMQVGPQITVYNPDSYKGDFEAYNQIKPKKEHKLFIDKDYEKYLAVPPPPPPPKHNFEKNKPYQQLPVVHTKPVQDIKIFMNIQHPVPHGLVNSAVTPKITSEIYFAEQAQSGKPTPTYTIKMPARDNGYDKHYYNENNNYKVGNNKQITTYRDPVSYATDVFTSSSNKTIPTNNIQQYENTYSVTLNTATNVASNVADSRPLVDTSLPTPSENFANENTNIPIGTNFAIKVDDGSSYNDNSKNDKNTNIIYSNSSPVPEVAIGNHTWNEEYIDDRVVYDDHENKASFDKYDEDESSDSISNPNEVVASIAPSTNSHANFPMMSANPTDAKDNFEENKDHKRPAKLIPNLNTNSHGWYSSVFKEDTLNNINNIKVEVTTRKEIPLIHDYDKNTVPDFREKITSVGKPPTEFWSLNTAKIHTNNFNVGKPFSKSPDKTTLTSSSSTKPFITETSINYIPSNISHIDQPVYDIPIRDNSDETTTAKPEKSTTEKIKPVYENAEEVVDGEEDFISEGDLDGEVSQESMKVPVVTASTEETVDYKTTVGLNLLKNEVLPTKDENNANFINFDPKTQTEKPFTYNSTNTFHSNNMKPMYDYNDTNTKPRPFTIGNLPPMIDHQLHQPHWQINHLMINSTNISYEEGLDLNIGEEMGTTSTTKVTPVTKVPFRQNEVINKYKRPRPVFVRPSNNISHSNTSNIITSTVHIRDKKPLIIKESQEKSTLPTFTITSDSKINTSSNDIIDLSPPPPTMDFNFKPSTNDETIMGMNPPPPRTPPSIRIPPRISPTLKPMLPIRTPPPYRTNKPRTTSPRVPTHRPTRKPVRDEISTYRPAYDFNKNVNKRPSYIPDQPSPVLLPPPKTDLPVISPINDKPSNVLSGSNIIFPTPISSGWLTSSGVDFSSSFNFAPTPVYFPEVSEATKQVTPNNQDYKISTSSEEPNYYEVSSSSSERITETSSEEAFYDNVTPKQKDSEPVKQLTTEASTTTTTTTTEPSTKLSDADLSESIYKDVSTERISVIPLGYRNRTRKPYTPYDRKNDTSNKYTYKPQTRAPPTVKPVTRPDILYPTRPTVTRKIVRPVYKQTTTTTSKESIIESSETFIDDEFVKPTEILSFEKVSKVSKPDITTSTSTIPISTISKVVEDKSIVNKPIHHAGNEIKISDEIVPTKTEFRTTVVTLTKTLSEPPKTISSIGYVNLTHTLTVTHTETSLISTSEGAVTQTLMITNTQTSTIVDVITEVYTQVQPTTIIETVTKHIPIPQVEPTPVQTQELVVPTKTSIALDDVTISSEESDNFIIKDSVTTENVQKIVTEDEGDNDTFLIVMNKSQNGGKYAPVNPEEESSDYDHITRNEQVNSNGVSQVLFGEILLADTTHLIHPTGVGFGKECQPDCKASRNERCQRIDGLMKCVCRPGFARMFPDRPCKPTYTYSVRLALGSQGNERLNFQKSLSDNSSKEYNELAQATHEGINRMIMQSDLRDVYHGVHITGFQPIEMKKDNEKDFQGVMNDFYVQLSDNAHESRLKEVIEKYLRNNNYSLGGTAVHAAGDHIEKLEVSDFDECTSGQFHDCSEHAKCFNLRGTYTCSCLEGFADLSVNKLYPGRICSAEQVGCERCNYHGACYSRDDRRVLCECFQWYSGSTCHINLKVVLISLVVAGALLTAVLAACAVVACSKRRPRPPRDMRPPPHSVLTCIQGMPNLHQGAGPPKQKADRRALINERCDSGDTASLQNASLPYMPASKRSSSRTPCHMSPPPAHEAPPPPPAPAVMIPRARLLPHDPRDNLSRKKSMEISNEAKLISYLESGAVANANEEMRRKHSMESSYSANKDRHNKQGALVSAGFKVSTTIRPDEQMMKDEREERERERERNRDRDDLSSINKADLEAEMSRFDSLRKTYSQEDMSEWTDAERRLGELTLSEARSVGGTLPASTGRAASSTRLTHQEANTMAERDLGSTFLLPHVHLYKPEITSDVSEFDSL